MSQQDLPDLIHGDSAQEVAQGNASNFNGSPTRVTKDKNLHEIILCAAEAAGISEALCFTALNADPNSHQAKIGGIIAGLTRIVQRLEAVQAET